MNRNKPEEISDFLILKNIHDFQDYLSKQIKELKEVLRITELRISWLEKKVSENEKKKVKTATKQKPTKKKRGRPRKQKYKLVYNPKTDKIISGVD